MKITDGCIDHNALLLIKEVTQYCWDVEDKDNDSKVCAYVDGICDLANALKEVLKA